MVLSFFSFCWRSYNIVVCLSSKFFRIAVESYEQGWRSIPGQVERQILFLLAMKMDTYKNRAPCWEIRHCNPEMRESCPAWEFKSGHLCWFINGTICQGKSQTSWGQKIALCKKCKVFTSLVNYWDFPVDHRTVDAKKRREGNF
jgi:hypothetical protein